ncbi:hypothetical protein [Nocardia abscessus]|uniref:hypothetical protein n=1 Tax=Nocardia abscessus TaxID=120957 RepID=UPI003CC7E2B4
MPTAWPFTAAITGLRTRHGGGSMVALTSPTRLDRSAGPPHPGGGGGGGDARQGG